MNVGLKKNKKKSEKSHSIEKKKDKRSFTALLKRPIPGLIILLCLAIFVITIAYYPKSSKPITTLKVNFQDANTTPPIGWLKDFGQPFAPRNSSYQGSRYTYGWLAKSNKKPLDLTKNGFKRDNVGDILLATGIAMQGNDSPYFTGTRQEGIWEAKVVNGNYNVTVTVGDGSETNSRNCINVEGVNVIQGFVPSAKEKFKSVTATISVSDGFITIDAIGGTNTKLASVTIYPSTTKRPSVTAVNPDNLSVNVSEYTSISTSVIQLRNGGIKNSTLTSSSVYLTEEATGKVVPSHVNGTGGGDAITLVPNVPLKLHTSYKFAITSDVKDTSDSTFIPFTSTFTTGSDSSSALISAQFDKVDLPNTTGQHTTLTIGPDRKLYALSVDGIIKRFVIQPDGKLGTPELLYSLQDAYGPRSSRLAIGFTFDPSATASNLVAWVTHSSLVFQNGPDWDCKLTRLSGSALQHVQDVVIDLPRSTKDHLTNSIEFGPDGALYITQGSNTAMGSADITWGSREENLLSGAVLRLDTSKILKYPLDAKTAEGGGKYSPYAPNAPLTIYASGIRNAYDLVWHSNGNLYVPTNGSAAGGNTPESEDDVLRPDGKPYSGPSVPALTHVQQTEKDFLFRVIKGGYYGHPNPLRGEFVMNGGNPTASVDPAEMSYYPVGTLPDKNWRGFSYDFHNNTSPNGVIEYKSNTFHGALKGKLLVVRYSQHDDIITLTPGGPHNDIIGATEGYSIKGFSGFVDPLDLVEDTTNGDIYVSEFGGFGKITLLRPEKITSTKRKGTLKSHSIKRNL